MRNIWAFTASILGLIAVILGAFGAHALKIRLTPDHLESFKTGVYYQMTHAIVMLIVSITFENKKSLRNINMLFLSGILLFSGSIYLLSTQEISNINFKFLGPVTPLGGLFIIVGWGVMAFKFIQRRGN